MESLSHVDSREQCEDDQKAVFKSEEIFSEHCRKTSFTSPPLYSFSPNLSFMTFMARNAIREHVMLDSTSQNFEVSSVKTAMRTCSC